MLISDCICLSAIWVRLSRCRNVNHVSTPRGVLILDDCWAALQHERHQHLTSPPVRRVTACIEYRTCHQYSWFRQLSCKKKALHSRFHFARGNIRPFEILSYRCFSTLTPRRNWNNIHGYIWKKKKAEEGIDPSLCGSCGAVRTCDGCGSACKNYVILLTGGDIPAWERRLALGNTHALWCLEVGPVDMGWHLTPYHAMVNPQNRGRKIKVQK